MTKLGKVSAETRMTGKVAGIPESQFETKQRV
jgi:hypothetical protein